MQPVWKTAVLRGDFIYHGLGVGWEVGSTKLITEVDGH
jgi:hypothetical protein